MTTVPFTVYDTTTGRALRTGWASPGLVDKQHDESEGEAVIQAEVDQDTQFIDPLSEFVTARPTLGPFDKTTIAANGVDVATLQLPAMSVTVTIEPPEDDPYDVVVTDGVLELDADVAGEYVVTIKRFPYQDFEAIITAE